MPPNLATYQKAANAIYSPQQASDIAGLQATEKSTINTLEGEKPQIATDYQSAIDKLTQTTQANAAKINQLYSERLGGNFSGLQGNDLGNMYGMAAQQQSIISQTMANKLAQITGQEGNAKIAYATGVSQEKSKIQSAKAQYAQSSYASAEKNYADTQYKNAELGISEARLQLSEEKAANGGSSGGLTAGEQLTEQNKYQVGQFKGGNKFYKGPNGQTNLYQYAVGVSGGSNANPSDVYNTILSELSTGSKTDKTAYNIVSKKSMSAGIKYLQQHNSYIFQ